MEYRKFGTTDCRVSPMGLGCMSMSGAYGPGDDHESIATLHRAFDLGINFLDTSASYGKGHNHELIAKAVKDRGEKIVIHSKSGSPRAPDASGLRSGSAPDYLIKTCEESLKRLGVEALDVFCMSRVDPNVPVEESVGGMARLVEQGKARYMPWSRDPEDGNIQACREFGMGFMAYSPLGRGFFAGAVHNLKDIPEGDSRRGHPRFQPSNIEHNLNLLARFEELAREKSATPAQLALAWIMAQGEDIIPIPSSKSRPHLEENLKAIDIKLTQEDLDRLDAIMPAGAAAGTRAKDMDRVNN
jgi:aryl-alcohol dehydrogenase-like predicted oxidoreductase